MRRKEVNLKSNNKKKIIIISCVFVFLICIISTVVSFILRNTKINKQVSDNLNLEEKYATIFCSGKNITLRDKALEIINNNSLDLVIYNNKYIARIKNENITNKINIKIDSSSCNGFKSSDAFSVNISNSNMFNELKVKSKINKEFLSEYLSNEEFVNNNLKVIDGYVNVKLVENADDYVFAYIVPDNFNVEDITMNKGATKKIELGLEDTEYTLGSVNIRCSDENAISIDENYMIVANSVGEYTLTYSTEREDKEAKITINQSVEKLSISKLTLEIVEGDTEKVEVSFAPENAVNKELKWTSSNENVATVDLEGIISAKSVGQCEIKVQTTEEPIVEAVLIVDVKEKPKIDNVLTPPSNENIPGITYINGIMLVNKTHPIPEDYNPGLNNTAYNAFLKLQSAAQEAGYSMPLLSGFRSYETQKGLYNRYCNEYGQAEADTFSARPGTSEHQTGLAMDVGQIEDWYGDTDAGKWLAQNCYKFGFIIRYPKGKESITGYKYEPWHIRYLGVDIATDVYNSGLTLEEYLGVL